MNRIIIKGLLFFFLLFKLSNGLGQLTISGSTCIMAGTVYQYVISNTGDTSASMQVCISGGVIANGGNNPITCTSPTTSLHKILVVWNDSAIDAGTLTVTSSTGNTSLNVHFAGSLQPGTIDSASKTQIIYTSGVPNTITCSADSGGSCSPLYTYQWQRSTDMFDWVDIPNALNASFTTDSTVTQSTYYRRKVTEKTSGSIGYSDVASVFVVIQPIADTTQSNDQGFNFKYNKNKAHNYLYEQCNTPFSPELQLLWVNKQKFSDYNSNCFSNI